MAGKHRFLTADESKALKSRLGKEKDIDLAAEFGVSRQYVSQARRTAGIPVFKLEFGAGNFETVSACISKEDARNLKKAKKIMKQKSSSKFIREAIRKEIDRVLRGGK